MVFSYQIVKSPIIVNSRLLAKPPNIHLFLIMLLVYDYSIIQTGLFMPANTFFLDQPVRVTDLNYGAHVGIMQMHGMAHNARYCLLASLEMSEVDIGGAGIMALESNIKLSAESFLGDILRFFVNIEILSKTQFKCIISVYNPTTNKPVATVEEKMLCYDYARKKPAAIPEGFTKTFSIS